MAGPISKPKVSGQNCQKPSLVRGLSRQFWLALLSAENPWHEPGATSEWRPTSPAAALLEQRAVPEPEPDLGSTVLAAVNIALFHLQWSRTLIWNIAVITIRTATAADASAIWSILKPVFRAGETYTIRPDIDDADAIAYWCGRNHETFVTEDDGNIIGTYYLRANQAGGGDHVANCGYMTSSQAQGRGIARMMLEHSLIRAKERGFRAMQFNFVVSTNERAIKTWEAYGFAKVGRLPLSFRHPALGYVDAFVMYKQL